MDYDLKLHIRIDEATDPHKIYRFNEERYSIIADTEAKKLYRLKIVSGTLTQQEVIITDGALVETGAPITYVKS